MIGSRTFGSRVALVVLVGLGYTSLLPAGAFAQGAGLDRTVVSGALGYPIGRSLDVAPLDHGGPYVIVHLAENRVFLVEDETIVWSAPAGTGTGFRLARGGQRWTFTTPRGLFKVKRKEKDPIWVAPDWYYVEKGWRIPPEGARSRRIAGVMGTTALYLGDGIAIHGTNRPALLLDPDPERRRVSHGCIRLTNEDARTLYHMVDVGTPVLVY